MARGLQKERAIPDHLLTTSPMHTTIKRLLLAGGFAIAGVAVASAADNASDKAKAAEAAAVADMQKAKEQFSKQRDAVLAERQKLIEEFKGATEEKKKEIIERMQKQQKEFAEAMRELGKQQRDEARKLRETSGKPGGR